MNLITLKDLKPENIKEIFSIADSIDDGEFKGILKGKTVVLFFPETSIRTRISFEKGINELGGHQILFPSATLDKRESVKDVIGYIENWCDLAIIRHKEIDKLYEMGLNSNIPIINAMSYANHPCEILGDMYGFRKLRHDYKKLNYTFIGEAGNIANSYVNIAELLNLKLRHVCVEGNRIKEDDNNYFFTTDLDSIVSNTDVFLTDPLPGELRNEEYYKEYQVTTTRLKKANPNCLLNPCPPFYRGEEVSKCAINSNAFVGYKFKKDLLKVQQAIIIYCMTK